MSTETQSNEKQTVEYLRSTQAIRDRCNALFALAEQDQLGYFRLDLDQLDRTAAYVLDVMRSAYPDLQVPFHSRWRHLEQAPHLAGSKAGRT